MVDSAPISQVTKGCSDFNNRDFPSTFEEQQRAKLIPVLFFTHWRLTSLIAPCSGNVTDNPSILGTAVDEFFYSYTVCKVIIIHHLYRKE